MTPETISAIESVLVLNKDIGELLHSRGISIPEITELCRLARERLLIDAAIAAQGEWIAMHPDGHDSFVSAVEARYCAENWLEPDGEWDEAIGSTSWGVYIPIEGVMEINREEAPEGAEYSYLCEYILVPIPEVEQLRLAPPLAPPSAEGVSMGTTALTSEVERGPASELLKASMLVIDDLGRG